MFWAPTRYQTDKKCKINSWLIWWQVWLPHVQASWWRLFLTTVLQSSALRVRSPSSSVGSPWRAVAQLSRSRGPSTCRADESSSQYTSSREVTSRLSSLKCHTQSVGDTWHTCGSDGIEIYGPGVDVVQAMGEQPLTQHEALLQEAGGSTQPLLVVCR